MGSTILYKNDSTFKIEHFIKVYEIVILPTEDEALLCNFGSWNMVKLEFQHTPNDPWYEVEIYECQTDNLFTFYFNPNLVIYDTGEIPCFPDEPQSIPGTWSLTGNILKNCDTYVNVGKLTQDTLVLWYHPGGVIQKTRETWVHP